jgi:hypothetical protein
VRSSACPGCDVDTRALTLCLLLALLAAAGAMGKKADAPQTFEALRTVIGEQDEQAQRAALERFARDQRAALSDRLLAVGAWGRLIERNTPDHVAVDLYEAHLRALGNARGLRDKALVRAAKALRQQRADLEDELAQAEKANNANKKRKRSKKKRKRAKKAGDGAPPGDRKPRKVDVIVRELEEVRARLEHLDAVREGDKALAKLRRTIRTRAKSGKRPPADAKEAVLVARLTDALSHYEALDDTRQLAEIQLGLALFLEYSDAGRPDVDRALKRLVRVGGRNRDLARVRQKVRRARARVLEEQGDIKAAVHESLVADRTVKVPLHEAAFDAPPASLYQRSRTTAELCWRAYARGIRCAELEEARSGKLTFYDYAQERRRTFDHDRARMVLAEYEPLLLQCLSKAASAGNSVTNTTVSLEWAIELDGHVRTFSVSPRRLRGTPLETCFKGAFDRFRYPRYRGEMQHTQLSFNVGE